MICGRMVARTTSLPKVLSLQITKVLYTLRKTQPEVFVVVAYSYSEKIPQAHYHKTHLRNKQWCGGPHKRRTSPMRHHTEYGRKKKL